jgi:hypothetical protein
MANGVHPADHRMLKMKESKLEEEEGAKDAKEGGGEIVVKEAGDAKVQVDNEPVHFGFFCDGCNMTPIVGVRYKCLEWVLSACNLVHLLLIMSCLP